MFKKISAFVLALAIALAATVGIHSVSICEEADISLCDMPFVKVSF